MTDEDWRRRMRGNAFDDADVARCYAHRPPYAPALFEFLRGLVPQRRHLVDLGCGPGKVAAALADDFAQVVALDPSAAMIARARTLYASRHPNIQWLHAHAEDAELSETVDLVTAGTSIHWMAHDVLFPKLADRTPLVAVITGDAPPKPPWAAAWRVAMTDWLARLGLVYDEKAFATEGRRHEPWLDIAGQRSFAFTFRQSVEDFIACQHSRATWSRARMGDELVRAFDRDLEALLQPYAQDGILAFDLTSELTWGAPRRTARG